MEQNVKTENEAQVLVPDQEITLNGTNILVREFGFREGLKAETIATGIIRDFSSLAKEKGENLDLSDVSGIFAHHWDAFVLLLSMSTGQTVEWINALDDQNGSMLMYTFWVVNSGFFMRRLMANLITRKADLKTASASVSSSQH